MQQFPALNPTKCWQQQTPLWLLANSASGTTGCSFSGTSCLSSELSPYTREHPPHCTLLAGRSRSLRAAAPKHSFVWNQPRQPSVNAGSFWQQLIPHPGCPTCLGLQPRVACSRCWLLLRPWHLRHLELTWIPSGPQQGAQLCSQPELPERHLLTAPAERPGSQGAGERRAPSPAGLGHSWPSPRKGKNGEQRAAPAAPWTRCSPRVPSNSAVL